MNVYMATEADADKWNGFLSTVNNADPYLDFGWKGAIEKTYGHKGYYFFVEEQKKVRGIFPLFYIKPPFLPGSLISLPFCDAGGCFGDNDEIRSQLLYEAKSLGRELKAKAIEIREENNPEYLKSENGLIASQSHKVRMILQLPQLADELWAGFRSKLRSQVRKSEKNGLSFRWGGNSQVDDFYSVFSQNMKDLGSPVHSKKLFRNILSGFKDKAKIGVVSYEGAPIGAGLILLGNHRGTIPWASTLSKYNRLSPNMLLYWNFLKYACDKGLKSFDFGRSTPHEGTFKFKAQWGAAPVPLFWNSIQRGNTKILKEEESSSSSRENIARVWQQLPLPLANLVGPVVRKYISL